MGSLLQKLYIDSFRGLSKEVWILSIVTFINKSGMMVLPFLSIYLIDDLQWTKELVGVAVSCYGIGRLLGALLGGYLSDRIGTYKVMLIGFIWAGFCFFAYPFITDFYLFCIWSIVAIAFAEMSGPAVFTSVSEFSDKSNLTRSISLIRMAINLGISFGPAFGGVIAHKFGYFYLFIIDGITCILAGLFLYFKLNPTQSFSKETLAKADKNPYTDGPFIIFILMNIIVLSVFFQIINTIPVFFKEVLLFNENQIGLYYMFNGLLIVILEMPIIYFLDTRHNKFVPLAIGGVMIGLSYVIFGLEGPTIPVIIIHLLLISIGEIINFPFISTISLNRAGPKNKGKYMGAVTAIFSISLIIAPLTGLPIVEHLSYKTYWLIIGCICIGVSLLFLVVRRVLSHT